MALEAVGDSVGEVRATLAGKTDLTLQGCFWPTAFASGPDETWWVLNADGGLANAELIVYQGAEASTRQANSARKPFAASPVFKDTRG